MDSEASMRHSLIARLQEHFHCFEEVNILDEMFDRTWRADLILVPRLHQKTCLAVELKVPNERWEFKNWVDVIRQASSYVFGQVAMPSSPLIDGRRVNAAFVCPNPHLVHQHLERGFMRQHDPDSVSAVYLFSQHLRVGGLTFDEGSNIRLKMGTDTMWDEKNGFRPKFQNIILGGVRRGNGENSRVQIEDLRRI